VERDRKDQQQRDEGRCNLQRSDEQDEPAITTNSTATKRFRASAALGIVRTGR
jgi:hypothetical protein